MALYDSTANFQTFFAAADLSAHQYNAMGYAASGRVNVNSNGLAQNYVGILANKPAAAGRAASVAIAGRFKARAGAAIASYGIPLACNGSGRLITATSGQVVVAYNLDTAAADGNIISVQLQAPYRVGPF